MKKLFFLLFVVCSLSAQSQIIVNASPVYRPFAVAAASKDTIRINLSTTDQNVSTFNDMFGAPANAVVTIANLVNISGNSTGVAITTIATANWLPYGGNPINSSNDPCCTITGASYYGTEANNATVAGSNFYNYGTVTPGRYDATKAQFRISGLNTAKTYEIKLTVLDGNLGFTCKAIIRVVGATSPTAIEVSGDVTSQSSGATFTLQPDGSGNIDIWVNTSTVNSGDLAMIPAIYITEQ